MYSFQYYIINNNQFVYYYKPSHLQRPSPSCVIIICNNIAHFLSVLGMCLNSYINNKNKFILNKPRFDQCGNDNFCFYLYELM